MVAIGNFLFHWRNALFPFACLLLLLPGPRLFANPLIAVAVGALVAAAGQFVRTATIGLRYVVRGGRGRRVYADDLVTEGVYTMCRNPMYVGNVLILAGVSIASNSLATFACTVPLGVFAYVAIVAAEEAYLRGRFGAAFDHYCRDVPRWLARFAATRAALASTHFHWRRVVVKEYGTPAGWIGAICLIGLYNLWRSHSIGTHRLAMHELLAVLGVTAVLWLAAWILKKSRRLVAD
jgi:protein-S-isoprenylcysteine O-methyltransferase Ste14